MEMTNSAISLVFEKKGLMTKWRHDTDHNDTWHYDTQHTDILQKYIHFLMVLWTVDLIAALSIIDILH
jgi:hypothetical protein